MEAENNPYSAPNSHQQDEGSLWRRFVQFLFGEPGIRQRFLQGNPIFRYGVVFFVDPVDEQLVHAALPLRQVDNELIQRNVEEAKRELHNFIRDHAEIEQDIKHRLLSVRFISNYQDIDDQLCEPVVTPWFDINQGTEGGPNQI